MGVTGHPSAYLFRGEAPFFVLSTLTWVVFFGLFGVAPGATASYSWLFTASASVFAFAILQLLGYFSKVKVYRRKSDLVLAVGAMTISGLFTQGFMRTAFDLSGALLQPLFVALPALSFLVFGGAYLFGRLRSGGRMKIVLDLSPEEEKIMRSDFHSLHLSGRIDFLSRRELNEHLLHSGRARDIDLIIISRSTAGQLSHDKTLLQAHLLGIRIADYATVSAHLTGRISLDHIDCWTLVLSATPQTAALRMYATIKTFIEPIIAVVGGVVLSPLIGLIAVAIRITSPGGSVLYRQARIGYLDRPFVLLKFRTMRPDAESTGPRWASVDDDRVTPLGRFLRRTRLDELPQLWNVIRGEMGFFGPRPERPEITAKFGNAIPHFGLRTVVRPGITGWAQVCDGYAASIAESRRKLEFDLFYIQHLSPRLDLIILLMTIKVALLGHLRVESSADSLSEIKADVGYKRAG